MLNNDTSEIHWSYFHFSPLQRVVMSPPAFPVYTIGIQGVITKKIEAIQVGLMTPIVPPRPMVSLGTIYIRFFIVVSLLSWKFLTTVNNEGIASSSWDIKTRTWANIIHKRKMKTKQIKISALCVRSYLACKSDVTMFSSSPTSFSPVLFLSLGDPGNEGVPKYVCQVENPCGKVINERSS